MSARDTESHSTSPDEVEPQDLALREARRVARRFSQSIGDLVRVWLPRALASLIVSAVGAAILDLIALPLAAGIVTAAVLLGAAVYSFYARRLMYVERRRRSWLEIEVLRERQRRLEAEDAVDVATLALATGDHRLLLRGRPRHRELLNAVRALHHAASEARAARGPQPGRAELRRPATPRPPDAKPIERRIAQRALELRTIESEIQALADPTDGQAHRRAGETREQRRAAERAALEADKESRRRRRRGLPPTVPPGAEIALELSVGPDGVRDVKRPPARRTPEEIARAETDGSVSSN